MKNNTNAVSIRDLQNCELEILVSIDKFCRQNHIQYSLAYGTMLGAIRHKGFIPWDDDIDLLMPRPDYDKFIKTFNSENLILKDFEFDSNWPFPFAKVMDMRIELDEHIHGCKPYGAYVDIFPIDGLPEKRKKIDRVYKKIKRRWFIISRSYTESRRSKNNIFRKIARFLIISFFWRLRKPLLGKMIKSAKKLDYSNSVYVGCQMIGTYGNKHVLEKNKLGDFVDVLFENKKFKCFAGYDYFLTSVYGDYMTIPPESQRITHAHELRWRIPN